MTSRRVAALLLLFLTTTLAAQTSSVRSDLTATAAKMSAQNDAVGAWLAVFALSEFEEASGRPTEAIVYVEKALAIIEDAKVSTAPFSLETLFTLWGSGLPRSALDSYRPFAGMMKQMALDGMLEPITRDSYANLLMQTGQLEKAEAELNRAADCLKNTSVKYEAIEAHFGDLRFLQKRYDEARAHYQNGLELSSESSMNPIANPSGKMWFYGRLARVAAITGHPEEAKRWDEKTLEVARSSSMAEEDTVETGEAALTNALHVVKTTKQAAEQAAIEFRLGKLEILNGNYGSAASHLERSVQLYESLNDPMSEMAAWESLCIVYLHTTNYAAMESALARAHKRIEMGKSQTIDDSFAWLETWLRYKKGQATLQDIKSAMERQMQHACAVNCDRVEDVRKVATHMLGVLEKQEFSGLERKSADAVMSQYARAMESMQEAHKGNLEGARKIWQEILESNPSNEARSTFLLMTGLSYMMQLDGEEADHWLTEGTKSLEAGIDDIRSDSMLTNYLGDMQLYYDTVLESQVLFGKTAEGFETSEKARARSFLRLLGNHRLKPPSNGSALVKEVEDLRKTIRNWDNDPQPGQNLADLRRQYEALLSRVQVTAPEYSDLTRIPAQQLDAVRNALPENTTLLNYFVTPFSAHVWILDKETLEHVRLLASDTQLRRIQCWAFELAKPRGTRPADDKECGAGPADASEAYEALIAPLRGRIRKERLMIVPHGGLHYVPFAALYDKERKRYLVEDYPITYVPSASTILFLRAKESPVVGGALVLGDPVAPHQRRLPGAAKEARALAEKLHVTAKLGKEAQESLLYQLNGKIDLLHIAAHGTYDAASPLFSAINLAEGNGENGQLSVDEIQSELDLSGVNLVVLSACQSGVGNRSGGDEIIGLTRSILYAGSPGVIATLWNISDDATPPLIEKFYDHLLAGASAADALRAAQVEMLRDPRFADPRYWAAFFLTGDPQGRWSSGRHSRATPSTPRRSGTWCDTAAGASRPGRSSKTAPR